MPDKGIEVFLPYEGWDGVKGGQITGAGTDNPKIQCTEFKRGLKAYKWELAAKEIGLKGFPKTVDLVKVESKKIEFVDMSLKKIGFSARQVLDL